MPKKYFKINILISQSLLNKTLKLLNTDNFTFMELMKKFKFDPRNKNDWNKLKYHLQYMDDEGLIEERHFADGTVDYSLENRGMEYLKNLEK